MRGARIAVAVVAVTLVAATGGVVATTTPSADASGTSVAATSGGALAGSAPADASATTAGQEEPPTDATVTRVRVHANGSATWSVEIRTLIENDTDVEAYRAFQERFRGDREAYLGSFRDRMRRLVDRAGAVTDREMRATDFRATTRIEESPRRWGVVEYRFRWENFAAQRDGALVVGDVFESGYYLTEGDSMVFEAPAGYAIERVEPAPDDGDERLVRWVGPVDFADRRPSLRVVERPAADGDTGGDPGSTPESGDLPLFPVLGTVLGLALLGGIGAYLVHTGRVGATPAPDEAPTAEATTDADERDADDAGASASAETADGTDADADAGAETPADADAATPPAGDLDPDLLTDEERVVRLLERNGGRMKQSAIGDDLGWSASKTSRVLSAMADEGDVEKLRLGNENVIDLPEE